MSVSLPDLQACLVLKLKLTFKCFNNLWLFALLQQLLSHACQGTATVQMVQLKAASKPQFSPHIWHFSTISHPNSYLIFDISPQLVTLILTSYLTFLHNLSIYIFFSTIRYTQLLAVIEEIGKDIRPTYAGSKSSAERLKRGETAFKIKMGQFWAKNPTGERTF